MNGNPIVGLHHFSTYTNRRNLLIVGFILIAITLVAFGFLISGAYSSYSTGWALYISALVGTGIYFEILTFANRGPTWGDSFF